MSSTQEDLLSVIANLPRLEYHVYRERLRAYGLPDNEIRVAFLYWLDQQGHIFTLEQYRDEFDNGNVYLFLKQYEAAGLIEIDYFKGQRYYVSAFATSTKSPFHCRQCGRTNIKKLLEIKNETN